MTDDTRSLLTLLALILASGVLTVGVILALANYCLKGEQ
jgi:hypothetical protein